MLNENTYFMCGHEITDKEEDAHDDVLSNGHNIGSRNLEDLDLVVDSRVEVDMVGTDTSSDANLEVFSLLNKLPSEVTGMERGSDQDLCLNGRESGVNHELSFKRPHISDVLLEVAVRAFLVFTDLKDRQ